MCKYNVNFYPLTSSAKIFIFSYLLRPRQYIKIPIQNNPIHIPNITAKEAKQLI